MLKVGIYFLARQLCQPRFAANQGNIPETSYMTLLPTQMDWYWRGRLKTTWAVPCVMAFLMNINTYVQNWHVYFEKTFLWIFWMNLNWLALTDPQISAHVRGYLIRLCTWNVLHDTDIRRLLCQSREGDPLRFQVACTRHWMHSLFLFRGSSVF